MTIFSNLKYNWSLHLRMIPIIERPSQRKKKPPFLKPTQVEYLLCSGLEICHWANILGHIYACLLVPIRKLILRL